MGRLRAPFSAIAAIVAVCGLIVGCAGAPPPVESYPASSARTITINGTRIHYFDYEARTSSPGVPMVFIHGYSGAGFEAHFFSEEITARHRLIAPDLPGSGYSDKPDVDYTLEYYLEFLHEFVRELELERFILVGHSLGGMISSCFASECPEFHDADSGVWSGIEKLVLIAPYGLPGEAGPVLEFLTNTGVLVDYGMNLHNTALMTGAIRNQVFSDPSKIPEDYVDYLVRSTFHTPNARPALASITRNALNATIGRETLAAIDVPTLIIWGADDRVLDFSFAAQFNRLIPRSSLQAIPDCGHAPHVEFPALTADIILDFVSDGS